MLTTAGSTRFAIREKVAESWTGSGNAVACCCVSAADVIAAAATRWGTSAKIKVPRVKVKGSDRDLRMNDNLHYRNGPVLFVIVSLWRRFG
jgi:hypothetical protein